MSTEQHESGTATISFRLFTSDQPTYSLAKLDADETVAPELAAFQDFVISRRSGRTSLDAEQPAGVDSSERLRVPSIAPPTPPALFGDLQLSVDNTVPASYGRAFGKFDEDLALEIRCTFRPQAKYSFVAAYVIQALSGTPATLATNCYSVRTLEFADGDDCMARLNAIVQEELDDLTDGRRSPTRPFIGLAPPLTNEISVSYGETIAVSHSLSGKPHHSKFDEGSFHTLRADEQVAVREVIKMFAPRAPLPEGPRSTLPTEAVAAHFDDAVSFFDALLERLPGGCWPPFNGRPAASAFLKATIAATDQQCRRLVDLLMTGQRRPSSQHLAAKFLQKSIGLSERRLRELIRR